MEAKLRPISSEERILVHLLPFQGYHEDVVVPFEITQKGIAGAIGVKLTHVSRLLSSLSVKGLIEFRKAHVQGMHKKVKVYFLTQEGLSRARGIMSELESLSFPTLLNGRSEEKTYHEIKEMTGASILQIMDILESEGILDISSMKPAMVGTFLVQHPPRIDGFTGRKKEIKEISEMLCGNASVIIVYGNPGYGKSALLFTVLKDFSQDVNMLWVTLNRRTRVEEVLRPLSSFLISLDKMGLESMLFGNYGVEDMVNAAVSRLEGTNSVLVFDGYGEVRDDVVELFISLLRSVSGKKGIKLVFTAQEDTPYYCRFYGPKDLESGTVQEYHLSGLSYEDTGDFLGMDDSDELKRIHRMTSGNPALLTLIKNGNREALKATGRFSTEEANMLLYLAGKRKA